MTIAHDGRESPSYALETSCRRTIAAEDLWIRRARHRHAGERVQWTEECDFRPDGPDTTDRRPGGADADRRGIRQNRES